MLAQRSTVSARAGAACGQAREAAAVAAPARRARRVVVGAMTTSLTWFASQDEPVPENRQRSTHAPRPWPRSPLTLDPLGPFILVVVSPPARWPSDDVYAGTRGSTGRDHA